jgi:hypothetical protein
MSLVSDEREGFGEQVCWVVHAKEVLYVDCPMALLLITQVKVLCVDVLVAVGDHCFCHVRRCARARKRDARQRERSLLPQAVCVLVPITCCSILATSEKRCVGPKEA